MRRDTVLHYSEYRKRTSAFLLLLIAPVFSVVMAFRNFHFRWAKNLIWCFIVFYGYTFVFSNKGLDSDRYVQSLKYLAKQQSVSFSEFGQLLYSEDTNYVDILQPLLTFLVSRVTDDPRILFACFAFIFGFFYSRNVWFLLIKVENKIKREALPFLILFIFVVAIWQINGFRFYTAAHIFVYGLFLVADGKRGKGFLFCAASLFVHFSFSLPLMILVIYLLIGNKLVLSLFLYLASFFIAQVNPESLRVYGESLPIVFQQRSERYISDEYLEVRENQREKGRWFLEGRTTYLVYITNVLLIIVFLRHYHALKKNYHAASLFTYSLLLLALANVLSQVPSVGDRFEQVSLLILFSAFFFLSQSITSNIFSYWVKVPFILAMLLFVVVEIRIGFQTVGVLTVIGNPLIALLVDNNVALIDLFK